MPETDLLGDPIPEPLPDGVRLNDSSELHGHTILAVFESPGGRYASDMVIVTATRCWIVFRAEVDGYANDESAYINVKHSYIHRGDPETLHDYVSARELLQSNCIQQAEYVRLKALEDQRENEVKAKRAARLRSELAQLEGQPSAQAPAVAPASVGAST